MNRPLVFTVTIRAGYASTLAALGHQRLKECPFLVGMKRDVGRRQWYSPGA
jgi:hypothetical protein